MKWALFLVLLIPLTAFCSNDKTDRLRKLLLNLERIESASYYQRGESYDPGDTIPHIQRNYCRERRNPADTTIGASCIEFDADDTTRVILGYDGVIKAHIVPADKTIYIDDFSQSKSPFRQIRVPFFNYAESIIQYTLTTTDRVDTQIKESGDDYHIRLVIDEARQVEFFGKAYHMPGEISVWGTMSIYELWVSKTSGLPYRIRREMGHETTVTTISDIKINIPQNGELRLEDYYPSDYVISIKGKSKKLPSSSTIINTKAPELILTDANEKEISIEEFKSKVLLLNFTATGCGACHAAIPFLKELTQKFKPEEFALVAIESWGKRGRSLQIFSDRHQLPYPFLADTYEMRKGYLLDAGVPAFILLNNQRIIHSVHHGYGGNTARELTDAIENLLNTD